METDLNMDQINSGSKLSTITHSTALLTLLKLLLKVDALNSESDGFLSSTDLLADAFLNLSLNDEVLLIMISLVTA